MRFTVAFRGLASSAPTIFIAVFGMALVGSVVTPAGTSNPSVGQLEDDIQKRNATIASLIQQLKDLRGGRSGPEHADEVDANRRSAAARSDKPGYLGAQLAALDPEKAARALPARAGAGSSDPKPPENASAPGKFEVSEDDAERALERTLTATGKLLVPNGFLELETLIGYTRREAPSLVLFNLNRNEFNWALDARLGLPWESQFEITLPYNLVQQQITDGFVSPPQEVLHRWGNSFGDLTLGVAKTFVHESGWIPDLLGRITYETPTGPQNSNQVVLPSGRNSVAFGLTALKRQDPLVFVASAGYTKAFQSGGINPGDQVNVQLGAFLATSPETTLRGVLQQNFIDDIRAHNIRLPGSGTVPSVLTFGGSSILYRGALLDLQVNVGLTSAAPKYSVILSSTYRFGMPRL